MNPLIKKSLINVEEYKSEDRGEYDDSWIFADWNEFLFPPSINVLNEIKNYRSINKYPNHKDENLLGKIQKYSGVKKENLSIYSGSDDALKDIFATYLDENKDAIIFHPTYSQVIPLILANTEKLLESNIHDPLGKHSYVFEDISKASVIYLVHPNNPTGKLLDKSLVKGLIEKNPEKFFIIDEAYFEYTNDTFADLATRYENLIVTRTFSKAFGLAGLRIGYVIANRKIINNLNKIKNIKSVNSLAIQAANAALDDIDYFKNCINEINSSKDLYYKEINKLKKVKTFDSLGNYLLLQTENPSELINFFKENKILVRDRTNMEGLSGCLRLTVGSKEQTNKIIESLKEYEKF